MRSLIAMRRLIAMLLACLLAAEAEAQIERFDDFARAYERAAPTERDALAAAFLGQARR